jgi:uncharacterized membrane protein YciS (DUF1049 family)
MDFPYSPNFGGGNWIDKTLSGTQNILDNVGGFFARDINYPTAPTFNLDTILGLPLIFFIGFVLMVLLIIGAVYARLRLRELHKKDKEKYASYFIRPTPVQRSNERWGKVEVLFQSPNSSDWRLAIIEADAMLDELTQLMGYQGANIGERLKTLTTAQFPTLQLAWEAHKTRNRIAHEGMEYHLTAEEAWRTFKQFEAVFRNTQYI